MAMSRFRFFPSLLMLAALRLCAQDAGLVLRTSVDYNTQRASLKLTPEQSEQAARLGAEAQQASQAGKYGDAMRDYQHGMAVMRNAAWTPAVELASSLRGSLDHALLEPGAKATLSLTPLYACERCAAEKMTAAVSLAPIKDVRAENRLAADLPVNPSKLPFTAQLAMPETAAGDYWLEVRLTVPEDTAPQSLNSAFVKRIPVHIDSLSLEVQRLRTKLAAVKQDGSARTTAEYVLARYDLMDRGEVSPLRYNFAGEFAVANAILDALDAGQDPFLDKRGDMRKAYRSGVDQSLQPYRLFVPDAYDGTKPTPLLIALHGMGGDENSMFDGYGEALKPEAQRVGFLVACPKGRDTASMYRGSAEQDVLDVIAAVRRDYKVDGARIYLMGHSMGGYGTWSVAMAHPELFAALGPISGGGDPNGMIKIRNIPEYVVHGDNDKTVNVSQSRRMVEAGKKAGSTIVYVEVPGGSHTSVAAPQFGPMLDFFVKQKKDPTL